MMTVTSVVEQIIDLLHCCDAEAQTIANRIAGARGMPNRCPDGVQVLEDAETIIRAATAILIGGHGETQDVEYIRRDPATLAALPEVQALIAAAIGEGAGRLEANRAQLNYTALIGLLNGAPLPEPIVTALSNWFDGIASAIRAFTPADATAALAARDAAMIARGMREAAAIAWALEDGDRWTRAAAQSAILARAAEIEKDAK